METNIAHLSVRCITSKGEKIYHLKQLNYFETQTKVTCLSESVYFIFTFWSYRNFHGHVCNFI